MSELTRHDMQVIDEHDHHLQAMMREQLERIGVQFRIAGPFEGDSSYPMEYHLRYSFVEAVGPTIDMALADFVSKLLKFVPVEQAVDKSKHMPVLNQQLVQAIRSEIGQAREEGLSNDDIKWMATGAGIRYGRDQGLIGDEVSPEMNAAILAIVEQELDKEFL